MSFLDALTSLVSGERAEAHENGLHLRGDAHHAEFLQDDARLGFRLHDGDALELHNTHHDPAEMAFMGDLHGIFQEYATHTGRPVQVHFPSVSEESKAWLLQNSYVPHGEGLMREFGPL